MSSEVEEVVSNVSLRKENQILEGVATPVMAIDRDFNVEYINKAGAEIVGRKPEELVGIKCWDVFNTEHCRTNECRCYQAMLANEVKKGETVARINGKEIPVMYTATPIVDVNGNVTGCVEYIVDLSMISEIEKKEKEINRIVNSLTTPVMKIDTDFNVLMINEAGASLVNKKPEELIGMKCYKIFNTEHCRTEECRCYQAMKYKEVRLGETVAKPDGKEIPILYVATPLENEKGEVVEVIEQVMDVTTLKEKEKEIQDLLNYSNRCLNKLGEAIREVESGHLNVKIEKEKDDEFGKTFDAFNEFVRGLKAIVAEIMEGMKNTTDEIKQANEAVNQLNAGMQQISAASQQIATGSENLSRLANESAVNLKSTKEAIEKLNKEAEESTSFALQASNDAEKAKTEGQKALEILGTITEEIDKAAKMVNDLNNAVRNIGKVTEKIKSIADQTNLLALNAAIEAARAGEHGRGFAVVADEVRKLAEESRKSTEEINEIVKNVQEETQKVIDAIMEVKADSAEGSKGIEIALNKASEIAEAVGKISEMLERISKGAEDGLERIESLVKSFEEVASTAEENASSSEETSAAIEEQSAAVQQISMTMEKVNKIATKTRDDIAKKFKW